MPNCCVPGCGARTGHELSLFKFAKDLKRRQLWFDTIEKETGVKFGEGDCKSDTRICSLHFTATDVTVKIDELGVLKRFLNSDAVPSIFQKVQPTGHCAREEENETKMLDSYCRICMRKLQAVTNYSIYDELASIGMSIVGVLSSVFDIKLDSNETYPSQACALCHSHILTAHDLKARVLCTQESLKRLAMAIDRDTCANDSANTCTRLMLRHLERPKHQSKQRLVVRSEGLLLQAVTTRHTSGSTFVMQSRDSSPEVAFVEANGIIELSSDEEQVKPPQAPEAKVYEQWPEEIEKALERQQKVQQKTCRKCGYVATNLNSLHKHIDTSASDCMAEYEPKIRCYICNRMFMMLKSKINHVNRDHVNEAQKECHLCAQSLRETPRTYENHLRKHFEPPTHLCVQCGKGFYRNEHYHSHLREAHDDTYFLECDMCGNRMKNKQALNFHMRRHTRERPALCDICSKNLFSVMSLKKHKFCVHKVTDQSIFRCERCDFCYLFKREFERHIIRCDGEGRNQKSQARIRFGDLVRARSVISRSSSK